MDRFLYKCFVFLIAASIFLLASQLIGLFLLPISFPANGEIPGYHIPKISKLNLEKIIYKDGQPNFKWGQRINDAIYDSIPHGQPAMLRFEHSWVLWLLSKWKGEALRYTQNPRKILMADAAICSQSAGLIVRIAEKNNVQARFVSLNGHVVAELFLDGSWHVSDPDFGVIFPFDAIGLSDKENERFVEESLMARGFPQHQINAYKKVIYNGYIYRHPLWEAHEPKAELIERWSVVFSWTFPLIGFIFGFISLRSLFEKDKKTIKCVD